MRNSIFDIAKQSINMFNEVDRLLKMFQDEDTLCVSGFIDMSIEQYVDEYCFTNWKQRGHFVDVDDFLDAIEFNTLKVRAKTDSESLLSLVELIYNFWLLTENAFSDTQRGRSLEWCGNYYHLKDVMDDILAQYNHAAFVDQDEECVLVIEDKEEITAAAEIMPDYIAKRVIKYNHRSLKGEIELKKEILVSLGHELEAKRRQLKDIDNKLEDSIFMMLNKLNLRHNNRDENDTAHYVEYVATMAEEQLEAWYDELYQMMLLAFLQLDNVDRMKNVKGLKEKLSGSNAN